MGSVHSREVAISSPVTLTHRDSLLRTVSVLTAVLVLVVVAVILGVILAGFVLSTSSSYTRENRIHVIGVKYGYIGSRSARCATPPCGYLVALLRVEGTPPVYEIRFNGYHWNPNDCTWMTLRGEGVLDQGFVIIVAGDYFWGGSTGCVVVSEKANPSFYRRLYDIFYKEPEKYLGTYLTARFGFALHVTEENPPFIIVSRSIYRGVVRKVYLGSLS